ncbi:MAG: hypothetical protein HYZ42_07845 [Bacteroidetes bacterium]|nr:hypothetical protein [Bacteroidota bacterium]
MKKTWTKTGEGLYTFHQDDQEIGSMKIALATLKRKATVNINGNQFIIQRAGTWKSIVCDIYWC